jgi:hypothetical protein
MIIFSSCLGIMLCSFCSCSPPPPSLFVPLQFLTPTSHHAPDHFGNQALGVFILIVPKLYLGQLKKKSAVSKAE